MQWKKAFWHATFRGEWYAAKSLDLVITDANILLKNMEAEKAAELPRRKAG